jgi:putative peptide zinc metalloprotease protein
VSDNLYSPSWYRVAELRPRLRQHLDIQRHRYRGQTWHILRDRSSGRSFRFAPSTYDVIGQLDGQRSIQQIWETVLSRYGDDAPGQDEVISLLGRLHSADLLQADLPPDTEELLRRHRNHQEKAWKQNYGNPLRIRFRLFDPDRLLVKLLPVVGPVFGRIGALLWLVAIAAAGVLAARHWPELAAHARERVLAPYNLVLIYFTYPLVKALHEFGHAFAARRWGAEVHEMGIMLLVLMPVPYVDASATAVFSRARQRATVAAAGIMVELLLAALALFLWLSLEPGLLRDIAFNVMLIGGVSTLLFNGNPLLRFDGYYILSDALEIPNLGTRANQYLGYLIQRYAFGVRDLPSPAFARGEGPWFFFYAIASFCYRMMVFAGIIWVIAGKYLIVGVLLAVWAILLTLVIPLMKQAGYLLRSPRLHRKRARALLSSGAFIAAVLAGLLLIPAPSGTVVEGVIWAPEKSLVRAAVEGFVTRVVAKPGEHVDEHDVLVQSEDPGLPARVRVLKAQLTELKARYDAAILKDLAQAQITGEEIGHIKGMLAHAEERRRELAVRSPTKGVFVLSDARDMPGRFVHRGEVLGYVMDYSSPTARVVVPQEDADLMRDRLRSVEVRLADRMGRVIPARIRRKVPAASNRLPSPALSIAGGGHIATRPDAQRPNTAMEKFFQFDLELETKLPVNVIGERVYVRLLRDPEPLAVQWYRRGRQLFLSKFNV